MSLSEVIIDEQALTSVSDGLKTYLNEYKELLGDAIRKLMQNEGEWNDEDFNSLLSAIKSFTLDVDEIEAGVSQLIKVIDEKIEAIHVLHSMKI